MISYRSLSKELQQRIKNDTAGRIEEENSAIRRNASHDRANLHRPAFIRDVEKIIHSPYYNRYTDKTQVFSLYKNDDISRRGLHVQLVSRIARNIGRLLGLNLDLIEAISLGHDIGHTPFGHFGESVLNRISVEKTGRVFMHNLQSVRVLDRVFHYNLSLQTLDGILCHNGEIEMGEYRPRPLTDFNDFDNMFETCYTDKKASDKLIPATLEGCVVRISDIIAYIGKDRQDALKTGFIETDEFFEGGTIGKYNAPMINNLIVNIVENSYGKDYIKMDEDYFNDLSVAKSQNYKYIYNDSVVPEPLKSTLITMFYDIYEACLNDLKQQNENSVIYKHHINFVKACNKFYEGENYENTDKNQMVIDFIAGMTDNYIVELYSFLFPGKAKIEYVSYFNDIKKER